MPKPEQEIHFSCLEVEQPVGSFYVGRIPCKDVVAIAFADIRRIEERDIEKIVGIQRELRQDRVKELQKYVRTIDATFPTSIILSISSKYATFDKRTGQMRIVRKPDIAKIIDGQHRLAGLEGFEGTFEVIVTIFVDMDLQDQAMTFATINLSQTKVNKSLVFDLYEFQKSRSPQKTCHHIARLLNRESGSPLEGRIKILGKATGEMYQNITQAAFVEKLMSYISKDPMLDRDTIKRKQALQPATGTDETRLVFRDLFISDQDAEIAKIVWNYFEAVAKRWPNAWDSQEQGDMLNRTNGFAALMRFLGPVYRAKKDSKGRLSLKAAQEVFGQVKLRDSDFTRENYVPGTSGETGLFKDLREQTGLE